MFIMEVKMRHFFAVFYWLLQLSNSSPQQQLLHTCCGVILLRSGGPAAVSLQAARLGVYRISGLLNGRPVYKHERNRGDATLQRQNTEISKQKFPEMEWVSVPIITFMRL
jgi:hypothetical protein